MLSFHDAPVRLCDGIGRREWLRAGGLSLAGLSLPQLWQARQASAATTATADAGFGRAKNCIVLFMIGGAPQHETWDPKPDAPQEVRGDLKPIASKTPGLSVGELMPLTAGLTDKIAALRAMSTGDNAHSSSGYWMLTGRPHSPTNSENARPGAPNDAPCLGTLVQQLRASGQALPSSVVLPDHIWNTGGIPWPGQDGGFLGKTADPWVMHCDPSAANFDVPGLMLPAEVPPVRFDQRWSLVQQVNRHMDTVERTSPLPRWGGLNQQAFDLLRSPQARRAFALDQEPAAVRDRYGRHRFGQSVLLARRLIEAGVSLVHVNWPRGKEDKDVNPVWDTHSENASRLKTALMPPMDQAYSALLEDLHQRGMLDETLIVWMSEFGRSPKINSMAGRDHWGYVFSAALAGGGVRGGQAIGASDALGGHPKDGRHEPQDLTATILHALGVSPETLIHDRLGRPLPASTGEVIRGIF